MKSNEKCNYINEKDEKCRNNDEKIETLIYSNTKENVKKTVEILKSGGVIIAPTETVYGIFVSSETVSARQKIFKIKNRAFSKILTVHTCSLEKAMSIGVFNNISLKLAEFFWPGAVTLIVKNKNFLPSSLGQHFETIGIRVPDDEFMLNVMKEINFLSGSSANISGESSLTNFDDVKNVFLGKVDSIISGKCKIGTASTIIDVSTEKVKILRVGTVTKEIIKDVLGSFCDID